MVKGNAVVQAMVEVLEEVFPTFLVEGIIQRALEKASLNPRTLTYQDIPLLLKCHIESVLNLYLPQKRAIELKNKLISLKEEGGHA